MGEVVGPWVTWLQLAVNADILDPRDKGEITVCQGTNWMDWLDFWRVTETGHGGGGFGVHWPQSPLEM